MARERVLEVMEKTLKFALTRDVSPEFVGCELNFLTRQAIDVQLATRQHRGYQQALRELGLNVKNLPSLPGHPDGVFVEDTAIVLDEMAVIARLGTPSRQFETERIPGVLEEIRKLHFIRPPGTLEGGDVLRLGKILYVGLSRRTNLEGIRQLTEAVSPFGYEVRAVDVTGCLHLKNACTFISEDLLLLNPNWIDSSAFAKYKILKVPPSEPFAANALLWRDRLLYPTQYLLTAALLERSGLHPHFVDISELAKAEGGLTCMSVLID